MELGSWIREERRKKNITQAQLGARIGVTQTVLGRIERGKYEPDIEAIFRLIHVLGSVPDVLAGYIGMDDPALDGTERAEHLLTKGDIERVLYAFSLNRTQRYEYAELFSFLNETFRGLLDFFDNERAQNIQFAPFSWLSSDLFTAQLEHPGIRQHRDHDEARSLQTYVGLTREIISGGGALTFADVGMYVRALRMGVGATIIQLNKELKNAISTATISTLERGTIGTLGIQQVEKLGQALSDRDGLFRALWHAAEIRTLATEFHPEDSESNLKAAEAIITLWRWLQVRAYLQFETPHDASVHKFVQELRALSQPAQPTPPGRAERREMTSANVPNTPNDFIFHYDPPALKAGFCRVRLYSRGRSERRSAVVILTELADNTGASVTEAAETIAAKLCWEHRLNPNRVIWIEHYPYRQMNPLEPISSDGSFDMVTFNWQGPYASNPEWFRVEKVSVEDMIGESLR